MDFNPRFEFQEFPNGVFNGCAWLGSPGPPDGINVPLTAGGDVSTPPRGQRPSTVLADYFQFINPQIRNLDPRLPFAEMTSASNPKVADSSPHRLQKTAMCESWLQNLDCVYGPNCTFAHGILELKPKNQTNRFRHQICLKYTVEGLCPHGHSCLFHHPLPQKLCQNSSFLPDSIFPVVEPDFSRRPRFEKTVQTFHFPENDPYFSITFTRFAVDGYVAKIITPKSCAEIELRSPKCANPNFLVQISKMINFMFLNNKFWFKKIVENFPPDC